MDQLLAIRVFARVVETRSFTKAADSLQMPKATVTKLIQDLEAHLRVKLLQRTTRQVTVTPDGAAYYARTAKVMNELQDIEASLSHAQGTPRGKLRIDVGGSFARLLLIPALPGFFAKYPEVQIELGVTDRQVDLVGENVDCVIRGNAIVDEGLVARKIADLEFITCATPGYLKKHGTPKHPAEIDEGHAVVNYVSSRTGRSFALDFSRRGERFDIQGRSALAVNESNAHLAAVMAGLGIAQSPAFAARDYIARGELLRVLPDWEVEPLPVYLAYAPNRHLSARLRAFLDWVPTIMPR